MKKSFFQELAARFIAPLIKNKKYRINYEKKMEKTTFYNF